MEIFIINEPWMEFWKLIMHTIKNQTNVDLQFHDDPSARSPVLMQTIIDGWYGTREIACLQGDNQEHLVQAKIWIIAMADILKH